MLTDHLPRVHLAHLPTPVHELPRLSKALGGPRLLIKRDDQTGLALGGNKTRKLEFVVGEALRQGADTLVTLGAVQSNHCRQTAAAAARFGLRCILVLRGAPPDAALWNGNLLLDRLLGADVRFSGDRAREEVAAEVVREQEALGRRPYLIPLGASDEVGAVGYVAAIEELAGQLGERTGAQLDSATSHLPVDRIVIATSTGGTQTGLCVGARALGLRSQIVAIAIDGSRQEIRAEVARIAAATIRRLGLDAGAQSIAPPQPDEVIVYDDYLGAGYAIMGEPEREAIDLMARYEGILLDPVYTGRAMAGLIDLIRKGEFGQDETILFWHTGGAPALFAYADELTAGKLPAGVKGPQGRA